VARAFCDLLPLRRVSLAPSRGVKRSFFFLDPASGSASDEMLVSKKSVSPCAGFRQ
jgi:hypothetical protein